MDSGKTNIAIVVYANYSRVTRVRKYAESLAERNFSIDVIALNEKYSPKEKNINLIKYPIPRKRISKIWYVFEYFIFFSFSFLTLTYRFFYKRYKVIQIHNMPDVLVFAALIPKIFGTKIILDMHDPMPELFMTKYHVSASDLLVKLIVSIEKISFLFSDRIITANEAFKKRFISRHRFVRDKINVILNCPDPKIFVPVRKSNNKVKSFNLLYMGTIDERFGLDIAIEGFKLALKKIPHLHLTIIPRIADEGMYFKKIINYIRINNLRRNVDILSPKPVEKIIAYLHKTQIGIVPLRRSIFTDLIVPVKLLEFIRMNIAVIASQTLELTKIFNNRQILFLKKNTPQEFAQAVHKLYSHKKLRQLLISNSRKYFLLHNWPKEKKKYLELIRSLL